MNSFVPDYTHIERSARNIETKRIPLYEHGIDTSFMGKVLGKDMHSLNCGNKSDKLEFMRHYANFYKTMGYDTVSFEMTIGPSMPGSGSLATNKEGVVRTRQDFEKYPWGEISDIYFSQNHEYFEALREAMPEGMKAIGGVGNGIFECVQDIVGYMDLCYISAEDPILYSDLFKKIGEVSIQVWKKFMAEYSDIYCVLRFGDDLGFKTQTLLSPEDIRTHIIPWYAKIIEVIHSYGKPFLLHSCGSIFDVMEDLINIAKIDAKHSNEDQIADFTCWVDKYGDRIGNFGGIDTDAVCRLDYTEMKEYIHRILNHCKKKGGIAFGSGNSIPDYVPVEGFMNMNRILREYRNEKV